jgi:integrase
MVIVLLGTGMRPSEVLEIRPGDIDRSGEVWIYRPGRHKTIGKGKRRAIPIVGETRAALTPFLLRGTDEYCFSPVESYQWHQDQRAAKRTTPDSCGNRPGTNRAKNPRWQPGEKFRRDSYRNAIIRAAKKAGVPHWTPYQLRHTNLTHVRAALGIDTRKHSEVTARGRWPSTTLASPKPKQSRRRWPHQASRRINITSDQRE